MKRPLKIIHLNQQPGDNRNILIPSAAINLHMADGERNLLDYYCKQSSGFAPSIRHIENTLHIKKCYILRARRLLEEDGLILLSAKYIFIDWNRIRIFASVDPTAIPKQRSRRRIAPVKLKNDYQFTKEWLFKTRYSLAVEEMSKWLGSIPEEEYLMWKKVVHHNIYS